MPGNPEQCRLNAARCLKLAKRARRPEMRETFTALADTWTRLAAEHESDEALLRTISELEFSGPYEAWPLAVTKGNVSRE
jgi:hypothetical protein